MKYGGPGISKEVRVTFEETDMDIAEEVNARWFEMSEEKLPSPPQPPAQAHGHASLKPSISNGKLRKVQHHR